MGDTLVLSMNLAGCAAARVRDAGRIDLTTVLRRTEQ